MITLAIDPGPTKSALVVWNGKKIFFADIDINEEILKILSDPVGSLGDILIIEQIKSYGMAVSDSIFDTVFWTGRFIQAWKGNWHRVPRREVKIHLCGSMRAKDSNIRQALIDRFGAPGTKKAPGLTYGISKDLWQAFALAVYWMDIGEFSVP